MESGLNETFDNFESPPEVQFFFVDADFVDSDVFRKFLPHKTGLRRRGQHINVYVVMAGILLKKAKICFRRSAQNGSR